MAKKIIYPLIFATFVLLAFSQVAFAQCDKFDFPLVKADDILFFNCNSGEIQKFDAKNTFSPVPGKKSLGGFIHNLAWSPDGTKMLILAENVSAATQTLEFYSPERELDSLNWWLYDFTNGEASLLDKEIISIGWISNDEVIYNWNNSDLSKAKISGLKFASHSKIADITNDTGNLDRIVSPISLDNTIIFPMEKGFYAIALNGEEAKAKYLSLTDGIKKVLPEPYEHKLFAIQSGNSLYRFSAPEQALDILDNDFPAIDLAFSNRDSLVFINSDKKPYSFDLNSKIKTLISIEPSDNISKIFSTPNKGEFLFVAEDSIYRKNTTDNSTALVGQIPKEIDQSDTPIPGRRLNIYLVIIPILTLLVLTLGVFIYRKYILQ